jgi:endonuclease G
MRYATAILVLGVLAFIGTAAAQPLFVVKEYDGFTVYIDCRNNGPIAYELELGADQGNIPRLSGFNLDPTIPAACQMTTGNTFQVTPAEEAQLGRFQRGHLADANSLDNRQQSMDDSFFVTNMLPQAATFNSTGAWRRTEQISECYREISNLLIWGGVIWGDDTTNDVFVDTHNVITPDRWWKVIYRFDTNAYVAWIFNNNQQETQAVMDNRIVTLDQLKQEIEFIPDFGPAEGGTAATATWEVTGGNPLRCEVEADPS